MNKALLDAGRDMGNARAGVDIGDPPPSCVDEVAHADVPLGADLASVAKAERLQLDYSNQRRKRCGNDWKTVRVGVFDITASN